MSFYGMAGYNADGTYRTGPAEPRDAFGRTAAEVRREQEDFAVVLRAQKLGVHLLARDGCNTACGVPAELLRRSPEVSEVQCPRCLEEHRDYLRQTENDQ